MASLTRRALGAGLEVALLPVRAAHRVVDDVGRIASAAASVGALATDVRDGLVGRRVGEDLTQIAVAAAAIGALASELSNDVTRRRLLADVETIASAVARVTVLAEELTPGLKASTERIGSASDTLERICGHLEGLEQSLSPMSRDLDAVRAAFSATNDELERLRHALTPELSAVRVHTGALQDAVAALPEPIEDLPEALRELQHLLARSAASMQQTVEPLVADVEEVREVIEPLQAATERVGHLAERIPGPGRRRLKD